MTDGRKKDLKSLIVGLFGFSGLTLIVFFMFFALPPVALAAPAAIWTFYGFLVLHFITQKYCALQASCCFRQRAWRKSFFGCASSKPISLLKKSCRFYPVSCRAFCGIFLPCRPPADTLPAIILRREKKARHFFVQFRFSETPKRARPRRFLCEKTQGAH